MKSKDSQSAANNDPVDVLQFAVNQPFLSPIENSAERHSIQAIQLAFASTGTVINLVYRLMYQVLLYPGYVQPLRTEISSALEKEGGFGDIKMLNWLHLLDSFIRETMRHYPAACFFGQRTTRDEVTLNGLKLEAKSRIAFPAFSINMDPANYKDAQNFDGFRFAGPEYSSRCERRVSAASADSAFLS